MTCLKENVWSTTLYYKCDSVLQKSSQFRQKDKFSHRHQGNQVKTKENWCIEGQMQYDQQNMDDCQLHLFQLPW